MAYKPNINVQDDEGRTPLMIAFSYLGEYKTMKIIEMNPDLYITDKSGNSALNLCPPNLIHLIAKLVPEISLIYSIIERSIYRKEEAKKITNVNTFYLGNTILTALLTRLVNNTKLIESFVKQFKPDPNLNNEKGLSPLVLSTKNFETFKIILSMDNLDVNGYVMNQMTNIDYIISKDLIKNEKMLEMLLAKHADINMLRKDGTTPFYNYIKDYEKFTKLPTILFDRRYFNPNAPNSDGQTFLFSAVKHLKSKKFMKLVNRFEMDFHHVTNDGRNVLFFVRNKSALIECLKRGADFRQVSKDGKTALDAAVESRIYEVTKALLESCDFPFSYSIYDKMMTMKKNFKLLAENWKRGEFETPYDAEFETPYDAEYETPNDAEYETSNDAEYETPYDAEYETPNDADSETSNDADSETSNDADSETSNDADSETSNDADSETSNDADSETPNDAEYETPNDAEYETPYDAEYETPYDAEYETPYDAEYETSNDAEYETSNDAEYETSNDAEYETPNDAEYETPNHQEEIDPTLFMKSNDAESETLSLDDSKIS